MRHSRRCRCFLLASVIGLNGLALLGCEQEAARARSEAQEKIESASRELSAATVSMRALDPAVQAGVRSKLDGVISSLEGVSGESVTPGQQAAAGMMIASARQAVASMLLRDASNLASENATTRSAASGELSTAAILDRLAESRQSVDLSQIRDELAQQRATLQQELAGLQQEASSLDAPISELEQTRASASAESARLRDEAERLHREARESNYTVGVPIYMEATDRRREADQYESSVALNELDLAYDLRPKQEWAQQQAERRQRLLDRIEQTRTQLEAIQSALQQDASATQQALQQIRQQLDGHLNELTERSLNEMSALYDEAVEHLRQAAERADRAASSMGREGGDGAKLTAVRAHANLGQALLAQADELAATLSVLQQAVASRDVFDNVSPYEQMASRMKARHDQARTEAAQALEEAQSLLESVGGGGENEQAITRIRQSIGNSLRLARGEKVDAAELSAQGNALAPGSSAGGGSVSSGFGSPEELLALMKDERQALTVGGRVLASVETDNPELQDMTRIGQDLADAFAEVDAAARAKFGENAGGLVMEGMNPPYGSARITEQTTEAATISFIDPETNESDEVRLIRRGDLWMVDGALLEEELLESPDDLAQMRQAFPVLAQAVRSIAQRVSSGEITSEAQLSQELMSAFVMAMMNTGGMDTNGFE